MRQFVWVWLVIAMLSGSAPSGSYDVLKEGDTRTIRVQEEDPNTLLGVRNGKMIISSGIDRNIPRFLDENKIMSKFEK